MKGPFATPLSALISALLFGPLFIQPALAATPSDYLIQSAVYQWYGELDLGIQPKATVNTDLAEYPTGKPVAGAHQILAIDQIAEENGRLLLEVELEYQARDAGPGEGRYLIQTLTLENSDSAPQAGPTLIASETQVNEIDELSGQFRPAAEQNLIRALLFRWTQALDYPGSQALTSMLLPEASFTSPEPGQLSPVSYQAALQALNNQNSRRAIKNLSIGTAQADGSYPVSLEYQWSAINQWGETELARVGVSMTVLVRDGRALIAHYQSQYLPPVTDPGAEIRC
ncbi:hypothetical protein JYB88_05600 [Shewanella cyperi]|uniref:DUF3887 domain-containing protein n=1 Tax=Shewanella cyperi TaxID=2814292 RepID=A0A974XMH1_9GAMM|nr:hypothetical protein [Shewanella cyperi]QSX31116.1 hypothetical protein JYB88_05600 [Shewanella cyperi]